MKVTKVHRVCSFTQAPWLKTYIDFNTTKRTQSKTDFERDFFKLMNNAIYGKTCENVRKRIEVKFVTSEKSAQNYYNKPTFSEDIKFNENLIAVKMRKSKVKFDKPISVGCCILELSKVLMYDFHYNVMKKKYGDNLSVLMTDTDSLFYEVKTEDLYKDLSAMKGKLDLSDYPKNHPLFDVSNKKVIGKMKDEANSNN